MFNPRIASILILSIALLCQVSYAQVDNFDIEFPWSGDITQLKEDNQGNIWFHDAHDYYSYNGHQVIAYGFGKAIGKQKYDYEIEGDIIFIRDQILCFHDNHLSFFQPADETIEPIWSPPSGNQIDHLYQDDVNDIWVFTSDENNNTRPVYLSTNGVDYDYVMDLPSFEEDTGIFWNFEITDKDGDLYIHDRLGGLLIIDKDGQEKKLPLVDQADFDDKYNCSLFRLDNKNQLWRIWEAQFEIYDEDKRAFVKHPLTGNFEMQNFCNRDNGRGLLNLRSIYEDSQGRIWLANAASYLLLFDSNKEVVSFRKDLVDVLGNGGHDIEEIYEDRTGNIWGSNKGGIFKIRDKVNYFKSYTVDTYQSDHPIYQDKDNATLQKILNRYEDFAIKNTSVHSIAEDSEGNIFYQDGTLSFKIDAETDQLEILPFFAPYEKVHLYVDDHLGLYSYWDSYFTFDKNFKTTTHSSPINKIEKTYRQKNGSVWLAGLIDQHNNMFGKLDKKTLEFEGNFNLADQKIDFAKVHVKDITEDSKGALWLGSDHGIIRMSPNEDSIQVIDSRYSHHGKDHVINKDIDQLQFVSDNLLWYKNKYEVGLINVETSKLIHHYLIDEDFHGSNMRILPAGDSAIWIGNRQGIGYHNFNNQTSIQVSKEEGIDCKDEVRVLKKLSDGQLIAGTNNGLYIFDPDSLNKQHIDKVDTEENIPLRLSSYSYTKGKDASFMNVITMDQVDQIKLKHNDRNLQLVYGLVNYNHPARNRYQHRLEGYEKEWSSPNNTNITSYTNLPSGDYTFQVKGTIGSGAWSKRILSVPISVDAAWYNTWWAILLFILLLGLVFYLFFRNRYQQVLKYEQLRSNISKDLHDDVGTILTGIAMQSEILEFSVDDNSKAVANKIASRSREAIGRMRDTVWAIDSRKDKTVDLKDRILDYAEDTLIAKEILLDSHFDIPTREFKLKPNVKQAIYLIAKESINNIVKHSDSDTVSIKLIINRKIIELTIKDKGSKSNIKTSGQGIMNMKERAERINAKYTFDYDQDGYKTLLTVNLNIVE